MTSRLLIFARLRNRLACLVGLGAALVGCVLPQAASADGGFALSRAHPPYAACPESTVSEPECMLIDVPTVPTSSADAMGPALEGSGELGGYSPTDLQSAYELPEGGGGGQTVALRSLM
jgi:hypothetical protein